MSRSANLCECSAAPARLLQVSFHAQGSSHTNPPHGLPSGLDPREYGRRYEDELRQAELASIEDYIAEADTLIALHTDVRRGDLVIMLCEAMRQVTSSHYNLRRVGMCARHMQQVNMCTGRCERFQLCMHIRVRLMCIPQAGLTPGR